MILDVQGVGGALLGVAIGAAGHVHAPLLPHRADSIKRFSGRGGTGAPVFVEMDYIFVRACAMAVCYALARWRMCGRHT